MHERPTTIPVYVRPEMVALEASASSPSAAKPAQVVADWRALGLPIEVLGFEPVDTHTLALARHRVEQALVLWEPRIDRIQVQVSAQPVRGLLEIEVRYRVRTTNTFYNLVYPFYLQEGRNP